MIAVEWGHGRRQGWLSNLHLAARGADGEWVMVGKTFKGLTDELLRWQTERFLELKIGEGTGRDGHVVYVRPEQVVEIALDGVQVSTRYPGGVALPIRPCPPLPRRQAGRSKPTRSSACKRCSGSSHAETIRLLGTLLSSVPSMSIRYALLALLSDGPKHGFQLAHDFEAGTGEMWPLNTGQVYTTLQRLERDGLVDADDDAEGPQNVFHLTEAGRVQLDRLVTHAADL